MTASTAGRWLKVGTAITRVWDATGHLLAMDDVLRLGKRPGARGLVVEYSYDHTRVLEQSVTRYAAWLLDTRAAARKSAARKGIRNTHNTPNDTPEDTR
ncbi:hypothetical protein ABZ897_00410 [Nonomuraea sp. NPDC046802]|uniref:hypothetical protein n=1 Tax=Nonomuraea sp. NPDC046802 TaxID=3154919 RepID=UPI003408694B